jgi:hypothetical protein
MFASCCLELLKLPLILSIRLLNIDQRPGQNPFFTCHGPLFAFITGINRAKGCLAILQYGLQIYVAALLTGHSVKPMLTDTRSTAVRFRDTGVPYFAVSNLQASAMHVVTGPKLFGQFRGSDVLFAGQEGSPVLGWWPSQLDFAMEGLAGSSTQQPPRLILPPHVNVSGSLSFFPKLTRMWGELLRSPQPGMWV